MSENIRTQQPPKTVAEYKATLAHLLAQMEEAEQRMAKRRVEINRLKAETQASLTRHLDRPSPRLIRKAPVCSSLPTWRK